jgi:hypothetical protein
MRGKLSDLTAMVRFAQETRFKLRRRKLSRRLAFLPRSQTLPQPLLKRLPRLNASRRPLKRPPKFSPF